MQVFTLKRQETVRRRGQRRGCEKRKRDKERGQTGWEWGDIREGMEDRGHQGEKNKEKQKRLRGRTEDWRNMTRANNRRHHDEGEEGGKGSSLDLTQYTSSRR